MAFISIVMMSNIIVIGGGAAGMLAAIGASENGAQVILLEGNEKLGKKIYITGKGRCNVTNDCDNDAFMRRVVHNPRFLYSALSTLSTDDLMKKLGEWGCPTKVERGNRVFPVSEKASDVTKALERELKRRHVQVRLRTAVKALDIEDGVVLGVITQQGERLTADAVIVCTGGKSYPTTGSTGDGFNFLAKAGHTVLPALPSLTSLRCDAPWIKQLQGLSLKNVRFSLHRGKRLLYSDIGEMLFTHFGVSGPLVLSASAYASGLDFENLTFTLDLKPGMDMQQLNARLIRDMDESGKKQLRNLLSGLVPHSLAEQIPTICDLNPDKLANAITKTERQRLVECFKGLVLPVTGLGSLQEAVVTRGGVSVKEVNPQTMESKKINGLYIAGELLDVDALTGGFNLQIAFSTGYLAGINAATQIHYN